MTSLRVMNGIPNEICEQVFREISLPGRVNLRLVCRKWDHILKSMPTRVEPIIICDFNSREIGNSLLRVNDYTPISDFPFHIFSLGETAEPWVDLHVEMQINSGMYQNTISRADILRVLTSQFGPFTFQLPQIFFVPSAEREIVCRNINELDAQVILSNVDLMRFDEPLRLFTRDKGQLCSSISDRIVAIEFMDDPTERIDASLAIDPIRFKKLRYLSLEIESRVAMYLTTRAIFPSRDSPEALYPFLTALSLISAKVIMMPPSILDEITKCKSIRHLRLGPYTSDLTESGLLPSKYPILENFKDVLVRILHDLKLESLYIGDYRKLAEFGSDEMIDAIKTLRMLSIQINFGSNYVADLKGLLVALKEKATFPVRLDVDSSLLNELEEEIRLFPVVTSKNVLTIRI